MRSHHIVFVLLALTLLVPASASADGWLKAVHAIDGRDLGATKSFRVDINVEGVGCALTRFRFGDITEYIALPAGSYRIEISPSDGACGNAAVLSPTVRVRNGRYTTAVAHLDADGNPTASVFEDDQSPARRKNGRITIRHTAAAPTVDITYGKKNQRDRSYTFSGVSNGEQGSATFFARDYQATIYPYLGSSIVAGPVAAPVTAGANLFVYAVGSLANGTFTLLVDAEALEQ